MSTTPAAPDPDAAPAAGTADRREAVAGTGVRPWATRAILASLVVMFAAEALTGPTTSTVTLWHLGANHAASVRAGQVWRLLSSAFLHFGPLHLLFNAVALNAFGPLLELVLGRSRFLLLYALAALGGGLGSFVAGSDGRISAGASGALWGLMAAEFALGYTGGELVSDELRQRLRHAGLRLLGLNLLISLAPGIDLAAHMGGGVVGGLLVATRLVTRGRRVELARRDTRGGPGATAAAALTWAVVLAALVAGIVAGRPWDVRRPPERWREVALGDSGVTVELPPTFSLKRVPAEDAGVRGYVAGGLATTPLAVSLTLAPAHDVEKPDVFVEAALGEVLRARRPTGEGVRAARRVTLGGKPFVALTDAAAGGRTHPAWLGLIGRTVVRIDVFAGDDATPAWREAAVRFATSLRRVPAPVAAGDSPS